MSDSVHAERRDPETPDGPLELTEAADGLLEDARQMNAGRSARTLTPQVGVTLKQTMLALCEGRTMDKHRAPSRATIQVLRGSVTINSDGAALDLNEGQWAMVPEVEHDVHANADSVVLLTVGETAGS